MVGLGLEMYVSSPLKRNGRHQKQHILEGVQIFICTPGVQLGVPVAVSGCT